MPYLCRWVLCCSLSGWRQFGCGVLLLFLGCLNGLCVLEARLAFVLWYCCVSIFLSLIWVLYSVYLLMCRVLVGRVFFYNFVCSFVILRGSSHVHWCLLFTCHVASEQYLYLRNSSPNCSHINPSVNESSTKFALHSVWRGNRRSGLWICSAYTIWTSEDVTCHPWVPDRPTLNCLALLWLCTDTSHIELPLCKLV
jgi:hypothetical protein